MRLFKANYRDRDGKQRHSRRWYADFPDHTDTRRRMPLFRDKQASREAAHKIEQLVNCKVAGDIPDPALLRWMECLPPRVSSYLQRIGLFGQVLLAAGRPLAEHLDAFEQTLHAKGNTPTHAHRVTARARRVIEGCRFRYWSELSASRAQRFLHELRTDTKDDKGEVKKRGISPQTFNFYLQAVKQFCKWMVEDGRATRSPLDHVKGLKITERRHERRALPADELRGLLEATEAGPVRGHMPGVERALLYRLAAETGLRANELRSLTRASFELDGRPSVTVAASYAKNRRQDSLPLRSDMVELLRAHMSDRLLGARAFNMPTASRIIGMFRADLKAAKIEYKDGDRFADFHCLRHTFISNLARAGVHPSVAQALARHSDIRLTMNHYTHTVLEDRLSALEKLPDLSASPTKGGRKVREA